MSLTGQDKYEMVVGLEVHARLLTASKLFCSDRAAYGFEPNTHISGITLAHPGTLPKMNRKAIEYAIRMGLACQSEIVKQNYFARKNYFYPDLPKGYQLSQHTTPICRGGVIKINTANGEKIIRLNRIHLEEDAGKSLHDVFPGSTALDFNRAGVPLIEIVSEPDIRSGDEAYAYLTGLRKLLRYLEICDGNMEEGSMRCDANISVRKRGDTKLGTRVEVKNLNSIRNVKRAIEWEAARMISMLEKGEQISQQTLSFDADHGTTFPIREKEEADDYRYFADPDLPPFDLTDEFINSIKAALPELQARRVSKYMTAFGLSEYDAIQLTEEKKFSDYFEQVIAFTGHYKATANWMLGPVRSWLNEKNAEIASWPLPAKAMAGLISLVETGQLSFSSASTKVLTALLKNPERDPSSIATELNLFQESDTGFLSPIVNEVLLKYEDKVKEYRKGKKGLLGLFVGEVMKRSKGKADPKLVNDLLIEKLKS